MINCFFCKKEIINNKYSDVVRCRCNKNVFYYIGNFNNLYEVSYCEKIYFGLEISIYRNDGNIDKSIFEDNCNVTAKIPNNKINEVIDKNLKFNNIDELMQYLIAKYEKYSKNLIFL